MLAQVPADGYNGVQKRLLLAYRQRLYDFVKSTGGIECQDNLKPLLDKCRQAAGTGDGKKLRDEGLILLGANNRRESIRLGSLFADHFAFSSEDLNEHIIPELQALADVYWQSQEGLYEHVCECMALLEEADPKSGRGSEVCFYKC